MKFSNVQLLLVTGLFLSLASCNKESFTEIEDNEPIIEVVDEEVVESSGDDNMSIGTRSLTGTAGVAVFVLDSTTMYVNNYSLSFKSGTTGAPGAIFGGAWDGLTMDETEIQAATYSGNAGFSLQGFGSASIISQEGVDAFAAWEAAGSDPATQPNLTDYMTHYDGAGLTYTVSNITDTTVDITIDGDMVDIDGNSTAVSGSFTADLYK